MVKRKKGFTTAQTRVTSQKLRSATLGTHVQKRAKQNPKKMNADNVSFSSPRKQRRAERGIVEALIPSTGSRESSSDFSRRVSRREFTEEVQRKAHVRRVLVVVLVVVVALIISISVGLAVFYSSLDSKLAFKDSSAKTALVTPKTAGAWYALLSAELGATSATSDKEGPDVFLLARVDEAARAITLISIPANLQVVLKDTKSHPLRDAAIEGDATLIAAVASFAGVDIAHYAKTDESGIRRIVDALGGVEIDVKQEVDDPTAGDAYIPVGLQTLDGSQALTYLRATNFKNGLDDQALNQRELFASLATRLVDAQGAVAFAMSLDSVAGTFQTDVGASVAIEIADKLHGFEVSSMQGALVPGYETKRDGTLFYAASNDAWVAMMKRVSSGQSPVDDKASGQVDHGSVKIEVRNGAGVSGGAAQIAELLKADGFDVTQVGNVDDATAYPETLIVYDGEAHLAQAQAVAAALGSGRAVTSAGYYSYTADVLVILGKDWKPLS